jgi:hypothetical protein
MKAVFKIIFSALFISATGVAMLMFFVPAITHAQVQISASIPGTYDTSNAAASSPGQFIADFYQYALVIGGILAFGVIVYGGIRYMTSAGNPSGQGDAKEWIQAAIMGILLLAGAYFILKVINPNLVNLTLPDLQSVGQTNTNGGTGSVAGGGSVSQNLPALSGNGTAKENSIAAAAEAYYRTNTSNGPGNGTVACAWSVNNVLTSDGVAPLDSTSVQSLENSLTSGRGTLVDQSSAKAGDVVVQAQDGHVGICLNDGCSQVLSNSSSNASFSWISNTSFSPSYSGGPGRIYRVNS